MKDWYAPYDSPEEAYVSWYLDELVEGGYVRFVQHQPPSRMLSPQYRIAWEKKLKTKNKPMESTLLQPHVYTADFRVDWNMNAQGLFFKSTFFADQNEKWLMFSNADHAPLEYYSFIEVKPLFDQNNMTRLFTINQKWMYDKYGIYVQKIIPQKLFENTFTPKKYLLTDRGKQKRKINFATRTLEEYVRSRTI